MSAAENSEYWPQIRPLVKRRAEGESWVSIFRHEFWKDVSSFPFDNCSLAVDYHRKAGLTKKQNWVIELVSMAFVLPFFMTALSFLQDSLDGLIVFFALLPLIIAYGVALQVPKTIIYSIWVWKRTTISVDVERLQKNLVNIPERWDEATDIAD